MSPLELGQVYKMDEAKEIEGTWEPLEEDAEVLVARVGNPKWRKAMKSQPRSVRRQLDEGTLPDKKFDAILAKIMSRTILLDWKNLAIGGEAIEYTSEEVFNEFPEFRNRIFEIANDAQIFRQEELEDKGKDLETPSLGMLKTQSS